MTKMKDNRDIKSIKNVSSGQRTLTVGFYGENLLTKRQCLKLTDSGLKNR